MTLKESYTALYRTLLREHEEVFSQLGMEQLEAFMNAIISAKRVFVMGAGREGISCRSFAMRLKHLGKETYWVWDDTTPGMGVGDLFIISDGRGDIGYFRYIVDQANKTGAKLAMITGQPDGNLVQNYADFMLFVRAKVYKGTRKDVVQTVQPMGNLYEQHLYLLFDIIVILLKDKLGLTFDDMEAQHRNIE